jgi:hypothetical protein
MTFKLIALFILGAACGCVLFAKIVDLLGELVRDWNTQNWFSE